MYNQQLETFIQVVESGSFNKAAEQLYITPPAVIKQINLLENSLELVLFVRTHRGLRLTKAGKSLYQDAKYLIKYSKESVERARKAMISEENIIRIGSSPMTPAQVLVDLWPEIQQKCPDIKFQIVPFENTPENAREILKNLGQKIDIIAGIFDETMLDYRQCAGFQLYQVPICCAVSIHHDLASKSRLSIADLYGEEFYMMRRGWSLYVDRLRDELLNHHPQVKITDFQFYNVDIFNQCENGNHLLMAIDNWKTVHPLLKIIPVDWDYTIPFGLLHSPNPSEKVRQLLDAVQDIIGL